MAEQERSYQTGSDLVYGATHYDGVPRQQSKCKVIVHSFAETNEHPGELDLSGDVIECNTSKTIKGGGNATFVLVPRINYMNFIFPNDYVNIYFDVGDGRGWIRTFFGMVDRVSRNISTDGDGSTTTRFNVACSDFTKAFDYTHVYFNPNIENRKDIVGVFSGVGNIGGVEMLTKGIAVHGSPADIVMSLLITTHGFGSQFRVPPSLVRKAGTLIENNRETRAKWARARLLEAAKEQFKDEKLDQMLAAIEKNARERANKGGPGAKSKKNQDILNETIQMLIQQEEWGALKNLQVVKQAEFVNKTFNEGVYLLDLIDFRLVEWEAIDGYVQSVSITQQEGTVWSIANSWVNDFVNELFCDLRPLTPDATPSAAAAGKQHADVQEGGYDQNPDELEQNQGAVRYVPSLVLREYPFATIDGIDPPESVKVLGESLELIYFGGIFAKGVNIPGRKVVSMPAIHEALLMQKGGEAQARKTLDVVVIGIRDIISEDVGRSDADHVNWIEVYSDLDSGALKYFTIMMRDLIPIVNPLGVMRNGLRVRRFESRYGRFGQTKSQEPGKENEIPTRRMVARWGLLLDHWYQHNIEYLSGTFTTRAFPEIRVGYRLDILERRESYYVEGVDHNWSYPNPMTTTLTVSRGQRNDPFPTHIHPAHGFEGVRGDGSRLGMYFRQRDPMAVQRAVLLGGQRDYEKFLLREEENFVDDPEYFDNSEWGNSPEGYILSGKTTLDKVNSLQISKSLSKLQRRGLTSQPTETDLTGSTLPKKRKDIADRPGSLTPGVMK